MISLPTRAKSVEMHLQSTPYGRRLVYQFQEAYISATKLGHKSLVFKFDPDMMDTPSYRMTNRMMAEYLAIKKYLVKDVDTEQIKINLL